MEGLSKHTQPTENTHTLTLLTLEQFVKHEVVVHRLGNDLCDLFMLELHKRIPLRVASLFGLNDGTVQYVVTHKTFLLLASLRRVTSPNCEKYFFISSS